MLGVFVNTLPADEKSSCHNMENFLQQIQMQVSQKPKTFSLFFTAFLNAASNFEYFEKTDDSHSLSISEIIDSEGGGT